MVACDQNYALGSWGIKTHLGVLCCQFTRWWGWSVPWSAALLLCPCLEPAWGGYCLFHCAVLGWIPVFLGGNCYPSPLPGRSWGKTSAAWLRLGTVSVLWLRCTSRKCLLHPKSSQLRFYLLFFTSGRRPSDLLLLYKQFLKVPPSPSASSEAGERQHLGLRRNLRGRHLPLLHLPPPPFLIISVYGSEEPDRPGNTDFSGSTSLSAPYPWGEAAAAAPQGGAQGRREMARAPPAALRALRGRRPRVPLVPARPGPALSRSPALVFPAGRRRLATRSSSSCCCCCGSARPESLRPAAGGGREGSVEVGEGGGGLRGISPVPARCWCKAHRGIL